MNHLDAPYASTGLLPGFNLNAGVSSPSFEAEDLNGGRYSPLSQNAGIPR